MPVVDLNGMGLCHRKVYPFPNANSSWGFSCKGTIVSSPDMIPHNWHSPGTSAKSLGSLTLRILLPHPGKIQALFPFPDLHQTRAAFKDASTEKTDTQRVGSPMLQPQADVISDFSLTSHRCCRERRNAISSCAQWVFLILRTTESCFVNVTLTLSSRLNGKQHDPTGNVLKLQDLWKYNKGQL